MLNSTNTDKYLIFYREGVKKGIENWGWLLQVSEEQASRIKKDTLIPVINNGTLTSIDFVTAKEVTKAEYEAVQDLMESGNGAQHQFLAHLLVMEGVTSPYEKELFQRVLSFTKTHSEFFKLSHVDTDFSEANHISVAASATSFILDNTTETVLKSYTDEEFEAYIQGYVATLLLDVYETKYDKFYIITDPEVSMYGDYGWAVKSNPMIRQRDSASVINVIDEFAEEVIGFDIPRIALKRIQPYEYAQIVQFQKEMKFSDVQDYVAQLMNENDNTEAAPGRFFIVESEELEDLERGWIVYEDTTEFVAEDDLIGVKEEFVSFGNSIYIVSVNDLVEITELEYETMRDVMNDGESVSDLVSALINGVNNTIGKPSHDKLSTLLPMVEKVSCELLDENSRACIKTTDYLRVATELVGNRLGISLEEFLSAEGEELYELIKGDVAERLIELTEERPYKYYLFPDDQDNLNGEHLLKTPPHYVGEVNSNNEIYVIREYHNNPFDNAPFLVSLDRLKEIDALEFKALSFAEEVNQDVTFLRNSIIRGLNVKKGEPSHDLIMPLYKEVLHIVENNKEKSPKYDLSDYECLIIAARICEEREEDAQDFYLTVEEVATYSDNDDWSEINNGIENMIEKYLSETVNQ